MTDHKSRDHRRKKGQKVIKVSGKKITHKEKKLGTHSYSPKARYYPELEELSREMGKDLVYANTKEANKTRKEALELRAKAEKELHKLDDTIIRPMLTLPMAEATRHEAPANVQQAFSQASLHMVARDGFLSEQRNNRDYINPQLKAAPNVRKDAYKIIASARDSVDVYGINLEVEDMSEKYGKVPPLGSPKEMKAINTGILPPDAYIQDDINQLHTYLITNMTAEQKPDAITLAQAYIKYRVTLLILRRQTN